MTELQKVFLDRKPSYEQFCQSIAKGIAPYRAYAMAFDRLKEGDKVASRDVKRMLARENVRQRIGEIQDEMRRAEINLQKEIADRTKITKEYILLGLRETLDRSLQRTPVILDGKETGEWRFDGKTANRSLELMGKEIGMFRDEIMVGRPGEFDRLSRLTPEELAEEERIVLADLRSAREAEDAIARAALPGLAKRVDEDDDT